MYEEEDEKERVLGESSVMRVNDSIKKKARKRDLTTKQFEHIWLNKIQNQLQHQNQFRFQEMNVLLNAYEYWRYESKNT